MFGVVWTSTCVRLTGEAQEKLSDVEVDHEIEGRLREPAKRRLPSPPPHSRPNASVCVSIVRPAFPEECEDRRRIGSQWTRLASQREQLFWPGTDGPPGSASAPTQRWHPFLGRCVSTCNPPTPLLIILLLHVIIQKCDLYLR